VDLKDIVPKRRINFDGGSEPLNSSATHKTVNSLAPFSNALDGTLHSIAVGHVNLNRHDPLVDAWEWVAIQNRNAHVVRFEQEAYSSGTDT
jgi:hypothetical protein